MLDNRSSGLLHAFFFFTQKTASECSACLVGSEMCIRDGPWSAPRYMLPILGMVLGNTMTAMSLVLDTLSEATYRERGAIEARPSLGAGRFAAMRGVMHRSRVHN